MYVCVFVSSIIAGSTQNYIGALPQAPKPFVSGWDNVDEHVGEQLPTIAVMESCIMFPDKMFVIDKSMEIIFTHCCYMQL